MSKSFLVEVVTPEKMYTFKDVISLIAPTYDGYLGILVDHAPMTCILNIGKLTVKTNERERYFATDAGYLSVAKNKVTIVTSAVEEAEEIDIVRAERARDRAQDKLKQNPDDEKAKQDLLRAENRIKIALTHKK